jgi:anti-sigma regulatory factor (Ser/Thr protein kinase)
MISTPIAVSVVESSQVGEARRQAAALGRQLGFHDIDQGKVGIIVTEIANNLVRYAEDGLLLLQPLMDRALGVEILALDKGPGMQNLSDCMRDGYSTGGSRGNGLGAIQRMATIFDIYSNPQGTALLAQLWHPAAAEQAPPPQFVAGQVCIPMTGQSVSGDTWAVAESDDRCLVMVADGLGHGPLAAAAAQAAKQVFHEQSQNSPQAILEEAHRALWSTRGAAVAIAEIQVDTQFIHFAGIGNISAMVIQPQSHHRMVSYNGTVGHEVRKIASFQYPWCSGSTLILHSDGVGTQWDLQKYPGLLQKHPSLIAGILYRDFGRGRDDTTVLVVKDRL